MVVDKSGRLTGIVSEGDFLHHLGMEYLVELKTVATAMTRDVLTLSEDASLAEALHLMIRHRISCVLITQQAVPVGILTERDRVRLVQVAKDKTTVLAEVMQKPVQSISADCPLQEAIRQMEQVGIRRLAVMEDNRLV